MCENSTHNSMCPVPMTPRFSGIGRQLAELHLSSKGASLTSDDLLADLYLPGTEGFDALTRIKQLYQCSIVVLSSEDDPHIIRSAIAQGAAGFIPKSSSPEVLVAALKLVLAHGIYLPPHVLSDYSDGDDTNSKSEYRNTILNQLTQKQLPVLIKMAQGKQNLIIARELHIAEGTVKAHLSACYRVLGVHNRTEAGYAIALMGLIPEQK